MKTCENLWKFVKICENLWKQKNLWKKTCENLWKKKLVKKLVKTKKKLVEKKTCENLWKLVKKKTCEKKLVKKNLWKKTCEKKLVKTYKKKWLKMTKEKKTQKIFKKIIVWPTDHPTDQAMDWPTNRVIYRVLCTQLKTYLRGRRRLGRRGRGWQRTRWRREGGWGWRQRPETTP